MMGIMYAAVLPEPVTAPATMSFPKRAMGVEADWMGDGLVYPKLANPFNTGRARSSDWKDLCAWSDSAFS